MDEKITLATV